MLARSRSPSSLHSQEEGTTTHRFLNTKPKPNVTPSLIPPRTATPLSGSISAGAIQSLIDDWNAGRAGAASASIRASAGGRHRRASAVCCLAAREFNSSVTPRAVDQMVLSISVCVPVCPHITVPRRTGKQDNKLTPCPARLRLPLPRPLGLFLRSKPRTTARGTGRRPGHSPRTPPKHGGAR